MSADWFYFSAVQKFEKGVYWDALADFEKAILAQPDNYLYVFGRARTKIKLNQWQDALQDMDLTLRLKPDFADAYSEKGVVLFHLKALEDALECMTKAQILEPQNAYRYSSRAFIKAALKDIFGAIDDYRTAVRLDPQDAVAYNNLGLLEEQVGYSSAKENLQKADMLTGGQKIQEKVQEPEKSQIKIEEKENRTPQNSSQQKSNWLKYFEIIIEVFTKKNAFKEFLEFCKQKFRLK